MLSITSETQVEFVIGSRVAPDRRLRSSSHGKVSTVRRVMQGECGPQARFCRVCREGALDDVCNTRRGALDVCRYHALVETIESQNGECNDCGCELRTDRYRNGATHVMGGGLPDFIWFDVHVADPFQRQVACGECVRIRRRDAGRFEYLWSRRGLWTKAKTARTARELAEFERLLAKYRDNDRFLDAGFVVIHDRRR